MFHIVSNAVPDQISQHHLGVAFTGGIALSPVPEAKARAFVGTVDSDAKLFAADKAEKHLLGMIEQAIICRRGVAAQVTDAIASSKAYAADLKKLTKDDARPATIAAQCDAYATDLAGSVAYDADCREWHSARFLARHVDHVAGFDPAAIRIALADLWSPGAPKISLPWVSERYAEAAALMGEDFWPYGIAANRDAITAVARYVHAQGLAPQAPRIEDLFAPGLL